MAGVLKTPVYIKKGLYFIPTIYVDFHWKLRPSSLRPRAPTGFVITNICSKTNWSNWSTETSTTSSPLNTPELSSHNTPHHLDSSPLSNLKDEDQNNIPFPELDIPELDFQLPPLDFQPLPCYVKIKPLKPIPTAPDYDLAMFFAIAQTKSNMPAETPQIFHGNGRCGHANLTCICIWRQAVRRRRTEQGERGWVGVDKGTTPTPQTAETHTGTDVLACTEAPCEDQMIQTSPQVPLAPLVTPDAHVSLTTNKTDIVDLYTAGHASLNKAQIGTGEAVPFIHQVKLKGPNGELVRIQALFDDGAMVPAMCSSIFNKVKHRLQNFSPSTKRLRMANGTIVTSEAQWSGVIELNGWRWLGLPVREANATSLQGHTQLLKRCDQDSKRLAVDNANESSRTPTCNARDKLNNGYQTTSNLSGGETNENFLMHQLMGQWRHTPMSAEADNPQEEVFRELPELPTNEDRSIYTRHMWPENPAQVAKILSLITFGEDLSQEQHMQLEDFVWKRAKNFVLSLKEITPILGAYLNLNVPKNTTFNLHTHQ
ncbi:uncharacterized protein EDB91DRAFT_1254580 [Suillus paluster]|uniref:uncharacterized protein n=1 Tax=Suillus paluster TaxID=48578 RepID=UPI001B879F74|nr:uncharacterized protein EDB91DRAFT_1254580 [Suillus paluster]KAG1725895.1 hypothetical protein EDB91DRAFT_1254580 [Suillus paluster]